LCLFSKTGIVWQCHPRKWRFESGMEGVGCRRYIGKIMWWTELHLEVGQLSGILLMSVLHLYRQSRSVRVGRILEYGLCRWVF